jgi:hypothetical protein
MGRIVKRTDVNKFKQPVNMVGEMAEKSVGIKEPPINQVGKTPPRPSRGKRPPVKGAPLPVPPDSSKFEAQPGGVDTSQEIKVTPDMETELSDALPSVEQQPKRRRRRAQDQSLVNTSNLLGTGGSL